VLDSAITEEMKRMLGIEFGPEAYEIEKGMIKKYAMAMDDTNPFWQDAKSAKRTKYGGIIAQPTFLMNTCRLSKQEEWIMSLKPSAEKTLIGGVEIENYQVVRPGDIISVTGKLVGLREKEGGKFGKMLVTTFESVYKNQVGDMVAKGNKTFLWY